MSSLKTYGFTFLLSGSVFLRLLDTYGNRNFVHSALGYSSGFFLAWFFAIVLISRLCKKILFPQKIVVSILSIGAILVVASVSTAILNFINYENYIYGLTRIHIDQVFILGSFLVFTGAISLPSDFFRKHYEKLIFVLGFLLVLLYFAYNYFPLDARHQIAKEDNLIENFQAIFLLLSGVFSLVISLKYIPKQKMLSSVFLILALGLFFTAGDEISWGQRIFGIQSPEYFLKTNAQNELTIHNHTSVHGETPYAFAAVGAYGAFTFIFVKLFSGFFKKHKKFLVLIPGWYLFPYFFAGFFYNFYTKLGDHTIGDWSEPTELMLYLGVFFYVLVLYHTLKSSKKK